MVERLRAQLEATGEAPTVVVTHMLGQRALLDLDSGASRLDPALRYQHAFAGCEGLGREIEAHPQVRLAISGHHHVPVDSRCGPEDAGIRYVTSPIGYPREIQGSLVHRVAERVIIRNI
jgi:hypothetical protein